MTERQATSVVPDAMVPEVYRVVGRRRETVDTFTLTLAPAAGPCLGFRPGQFNMLTHFGVGEVAISVSGDPAQRDVLVHTIRAVGSVTREMQRLRVGDSVGVRGPFGVPWPVDLLDGNDLVLIAGGIGLAPLRPVLYHVMANRDRVGRVLVFIGMRTPQDILFRREIERWRGRLDFRVAVAVDRAAAGWHGAVGTVMTLLRGAPIDPFATVAMVCGPEIMMRYAAMDLEARGVAKDSIYVSAERGMKCGIGLCGHCQLLPVFVCKDGPVFRLDRIERLLAMAEV